MFFSQNCYVLPSGLGKQSVFYSYYFLRLKLYQLGHFSISLSGIFSISLSGIF